MTGSTQVAFGFLTGSEERGVCANERIEPLAQIARLRFGEAAAHLSGIEQPVALTATHIEGGDPPRLGAELLDEGYDRERVAFAALYLDPASTRPER